MKQLIITIFISLFLMTGISYADDIGTFSCQYPKYCDETGLHKAEKLFILSFEVNLEDNTAYATGNNGYNKVNVISSESGITFIEITQAGNIMTTTIAPSGKSVHSRNPIIYGTLVPSQWYGHCNCK